MHNRVIIWVYLIVGAANIISRFLGLVGFDEYTKPLLMPLLVFYVYRYSEGYITLPRILLVVALIFSWVGDLLLMNEGTAFFLGGLGAFLVAQLTYTMVLYQSTDSSIRWSFIKVLPFLVYAVIMLVILLPGSGSMGFPIFFYALGISAMVVTAHHRKGLTNIESYRMVMAGAILFIFSDSLIAIDRFKLSIPHAGVLIMMTYVLAQVLLVRGVLVCGWKSKE